jgi:ABC-type multidrug transport system permease subunit
MKFKFIDPDQIMGAVLALVILAVGVFAFFVTITNIPSTVPRPGGGQNATSGLSNSTYLAILNVSATGNQVFNIIGVVLIIAAIMAIVGLVYSYIKPRM